MPVNGWLGLAFDLRRSADVEHSLTERHRELCQLRRAVQIATHARPRPAEASEAATIRRAIVEAQHAVLRHAVRTGEVDLVRRAGRVLRVTDFTGDRSAVEGLLAVVRDARSRDAEILDAATELATLCPV